MNRPINSQRLNSNSANALVKLLIATITYGLLVACTHDYQPKPKGYNRLVLPKEEYRLLPDSLPYQFEYSRHAKLLKDTSWITEKHFVEIYYPDLKANIHITYKKINGRQTLLKELMNDAYNLTSKQQIKANAIDEVITKTPSGKTVVIAEIAGEVPSQFQFTMTDSTRNFLRGALYFNTRVQNDSLAPAIDFMKNEARHLINTLQWKP
ncbi:MAG: gliding motility lipoprotein GldD [Bacteroidetes bacterium]|nr:gliding motility lipoprotein GldD [Bacteroidota bacterium]MBS1540589.1 gliding motility lipoprotein GldD [Bacteroidota bacterium]